MQSRHNKIQKTNHSSSSTAAESSKLSTQTTKTPLLSSTGLFSLGQSAHIAEICLAWNTFIKDPAAKVDEGIKTKINAYSKYFTLYHHEGHFLLDINTDDFFQFNRKTYDSDLDSTVAEELPFMKACHEASPVSFRHMYFWSQDGLNFHLMHEQVGNYDGLEKTIFFTAFDRIQKIKTICEIKYTSLKAIVQEAEVEKNVSYDESNIDYDFDEESDNNSDTSDNSTVTIESPSPKELMTFDVCPKKAVELLLQFILSEQIKMLPFSSPVKPLYLFSFNENDFIFIGQRDNDRIIKIKKDNAWTELHPDRIFMPSNNSETMQFLFEDHPEIDLIEITNPRSHSYQAFIQMNESESIDLKLVELVPEVLAQLDFIRSDADNLHPSPLDVISSETRIPSLSK